MKNKIELFDDYAKCYIPDKCFFLLDLDDVEMAGQYHWILNKDGYDKAAQEYFGEFAVLNNYVA